jgi:hypothetical protein
VRSLIAAWGLDVGGGGRAEGEGAHRRRRRILDGVNVLLLGGTRFIGADPRPARCMIRDRRLVPLLLLAPVFLTFAGCGGAVRTSTHSGRTITVPSYAAFPATTIIGTYSASACRADARSYVRDALLFVEHFGPQAAYSADTYYIDLRLVFADFQARGCDNKVLGNAIKTRMSSRQRASLISNLPEAMAQAVRDGLKSS